MNLYDDCIEMEDHFLDKFPFWDDPKTFCLFFYILHHTKLSEVGDPTIDIGECLLFGPPPGFNDHSYAVAKRELKYSGQVTFKKSILGTIAKLVNLKKVSDDGVHYKWRISL